MSESASEFRPVAEAHLQQLGVSPSRSPSSPPILSRQQQKVACPAASASSGFAIRRLNGIDSSRRSDSIRNSCSAGPGSRIRWPKCRNSGCDAARLRAQAPHPEQGGAGKSVPCMGRNVKDSERRHSARVLPRLHARSDPVLQKFCWRLLSGDFYRLSNVPLQYQRAK